MLACGCRGIEEIAVYLEEPFSVLPLESMSNRLERTVTDMLAEQQRMATCLDHVPTGTSTGAACEDGLGALPSLGSVPFA